MVVWSESSGFFHTYKGVDVKPFLYGLCVVLVVLAILALIGIRVNVG